MTGVPVREELLSHPYRSLVWGREGFKDRRLRPAEGSRDRKPRLQRAIIMQPRRALK